MDQRAWELFDPEIAPVDGDLAGYLGRMLDRIVPWCAATSASIFLHASGDTYRLAAQTQSESPIPAEAIVVTGQGVAGAALAAGVPLLVNDPTEMPCLNGKFDRARHEIGSSMVIPLALTGRPPVGVLNLARRENLPSFGDEDLAHARAVAHQIALAITNAQMVAQVRHQAEEASRLKRLAEIGQMTAAIAHEIRNPLTGIRGAAQMVAMCPEEAVEFARIIDEETVKLNDLCEEFLDFARPVPLRRSEVRLPELAQRVFRTELPAFEQAGINLVWEAAPNPPTISIDAHRVEQVLRNLLQNARQASAPGSRTTLRVGVATLEVEDTGMGMSQETVERLFTPFFTTKAQGTGLGLSNVRKIIETHGGKLEVTSELGRGSRFVVDLGVAA